MDEQAAHGHTCHASAQLADRLTRLLVMLNELVDVERVCFCCLFTVLRPPTKVHQTCVRVSLL